MLILNLTETISEGEKERKGDVLTSGHVLRRRRELHSIHTHTTHDPRLIERNSYVNHFSNIEYNDKRMRRLGVLISKKSVSSVTTPSPVILSHPGNGLPAGRKFAAHILTKVEQQQQDAYLFVASVIVLYPLTRVRVFHSCCPLLPTIGMRLPANVSRAYRLSLISLACCLNRASSRTSKHSKHIKVSAEKR